MTPNEAAVAAIEYAIDNQEAEEKRKQSQEQRRVLGAAFAEEVGPLVNAGWRRYGESQHCSKETPDCWFLVSKLEPGGYSLTIQGSQHQFDTVPEALAFAEEVERELAALLAAV